MKDSIRCIEKEREALLKFKDELIDEHGRLSSWGNEKYKKDCCKWSGVFCDNQTNHIVGLDIGNPYETTPLRGEVSCPALSSSLEVLDLSNNTFNGTMSQCIGSLSKLEVLFLGSNNFEDIITESYFFNVSQLQFLQLSYNPGISFNISSGWNPPFQATNVYLAGCKVGPHFPTWLRTQTRLEYLDISNAEISDTFPDWFWELSPKLSGLIVSHNNFQGVLPDLSSKFSTFGTIDLSFNHFNGSLPILPHNGSVLDLSSNEFSGSNEFFGSIPSNLCHLAHLQVLDFSLNKISGGIPKCLNNLTAMIQVGSAFDRSFLLQYSEGFESAFLTWKGKEAEYINTLNLVKLIDLSCNNLEGVVPDEITSLVMLVGLNLSRNNLSGFLPTNIGQLRLSYNNLLGKIPKSIHLQTFNDSAFEGNPGLCGLPLTKVCPGDENAQVPKINENADGMKNPEEEDELINEGFYISIAVGFVFGFWGVCGTLIVNDSLRIAFFKLWNCVMDWVYIKIAISKIRLREACHKFVKF
ncbi:unnamed protein product [Fraxinus pennsylvanica]|uniref:Leucine-rich repeat-containing N-terminal plant-type domain-containing protein n=1 Tax=Fraxinus pennsylvanica TaxID=56036 RepID=A0AAD1ZWV7_9LAMI|nr:unnamed protein product [Fraxinus pennsylvanica]